MTDSGKQQTHTLTKKPYGVISGYLYANFGLLGISSLLFGCLGLTGVVSSRSGKDIHVILFFIVAGVACLFLATIIRWYVAAKAKRLGYSKIPGSFTAYSISVFAKAFMIFSIVFIPLVFRIAGYRTKKELRKTSDGLDVLVHYAGGGKYEDDYGNVYYED